MRYSGNILKRYLSVDHPAQEIADRLTLTTCEVEQIHERELPDLVVIGKVLEVKSHPNADKLVVCQVDCGSHGTYQVCTGGENVYAGGYVPYALPGCYLPAINLKIEPREMRGEASDGMICSKEELGIPEDIEQHRIWMLQYAPDEDLTQVPQQPDMDDIQDDDVGRSLSDKYPRLDNRVVEVDNKTITHRPDLFGHFGLSVELHQIYGSQSVSFTAGRDWMTKLETNIFEILEHADQTSRQVHIESDGVQSYLLVELNEIEMRPSDLYLRVQLHDLELTPKLNRVDLSNLFMYQTGQPVHFFDADKVDGDIIVRQAAQGEQFTDLFGEKHTLLPEDIVIADRHKVLALAGIVGSDSSGIGASTTDILVEIANFDPVQVRKTATRLGLRTDAELRFEKHINPLYTLHTMTMLLDELTYHAKTLGSYKLGGIRRRVNQHSRESVHPSISSDPEMISSTIYGEQQDGFADQARSILAGLGFAISDDRTVVPPVWRSPDDITCEADLIEEVARLVGYDHLPELAVTDTVRFVPYIQSVARRRQVERFLVERSRFDQVETYPWLHQRRHELLGLAVDQLYQLTNPLSPETSYLRPTILRSMLEVIEKNAPQHDQLCLFDIGQTWQRDRDPIEQTMVGCAVWQKSSTDRQSDPFLMLKGHLQALFGEETGGALEIIPGQLSAFHPVQQGVIQRDGREIGRIGTVHPLIAEQAKLPDGGRVVLAEFQLSALPEGGSTTDYQTIHDQLVRRDMSFLIARDQPYGPYIQAVQSVEAVDQVELFDLYAGERISQDHKSLSIRFQISGDGKLDNQQINQIMEQVSTVVTSKGAVLRDQSSTDA